MPSPQDVAEFLSRYPDEEWIGFIMDVAKAHKRVKVAQEDQGHSLFAVIDEHGCRHWLCYATCHFGAAYWWSRAAACFSHWPSSAPAPALSCHVINYVDDLLGLLRRGKAGSDACLLICLAVALGLPRSWRKLRLGTALKWVGWGVSLRVATRAMLPEDKRERLLAALEPLCQSGSWVSRKELEKCLGLLCWFASLSPSRRCWLRDLFYRPSQVVLRHLDARQLPELQRSLTSSGQVQSVISSPAISAGWRVLEVNHQAWCRSSAVHGVVLKISHVAGERNPWGDALSRGRCKAPALWKRLDGGKRRYLDWSQLLSCSSEWPKRRKCRRHLFAAACNCSKILSSWTSSEAIRSTSVDLWCIMSAYGLARRARAACATLCLASSEVNS